MFCMKEERGAKKLTLKQLALETGTSESYMSQIESGARRPSVEVAKRIGAALGFEWTRFFEEGGERKEDT